MERKEQQKMKMHSFTVVFEPAKEGGYIVHVPALPGCSTQGETFEEAQTMARDAIEGYIAALRDLKEEVPLESDKLIIGRVSATVSG